MRIQKHFGSFAFHLAFLLFALKALAQPGGSTHIIDIYFTLPAEMEGSIDFGPIEERELNFNCHLHYEKGKPEKLSKSLFYEEATYSEPAQVHVQYRFEMEQYDFLILDSLTVCLTSDKNKYTTTLLPNESCICDFTNELKNQKWGKCKTRTIYPTDSLDQERLSATINRLKNKKDSKEPSYPLSANVLRVVDSDNKPVYPLVLVNGDTCKIVEGNGINANILPFGWENQKISIQIFHPDYPTLKLDSVSRQGGMHDYVHLLNEDESYYLDGGKPMPLETAYKELAFWFDPLVDDKTKDSIVHVLTTVWHLELTKDWARIIEEEKDSLGAGFFEFKYGCFDNQLKRVLHFKRKEDQEFSHTYSIAEHFPEIWKTQVPVSFYQYLVPRLIIHFKKGLTETEILHFEKEYLPAFERIDFDTYRTENNLIRRTYQFPEWIYVPNHLQQMIMNDSRVRYCGGAFDQHILCE